ncbi:MAG: glycosyltransferase [Geminicoccaceae bacterium]
MKAPLVVFGEDWGGHPSSTQHLVRRLAAERDVVWVNSIGLRRPTLTRADFARLGRKLRGVTPKSTAVTAPKPDRLTVVDPRAIPWPGQPIARRLNRQLLGRQVRQALEQRNLDHPILWTSLPTAVDVVGELGERGVVYYCGDDFGALAGVDHAPVMALEHELAECADLVLAASRKLADRFETKKTALVPHGVDFDLFAAGGERPAELPADTPIAGFYGSLSDWIDVDLLAGVAARMPEWQFALIGPVRTDVSRLSGTPNVRLLGEMPHARLPAFVANWTVSLLPFRDNDQIRACNPLKLREYLAGGTPVVSTEFPALDGYRDHVRVAVDPDSFAGAIRAAADEPPTKRDLRRRQVADESWDARAAQVDELLDRFA